MSGGVLGRCATSAAALTSRPSTRTARPWTAGCLKTLSISTNATSLAVGYTCDEMTMTPMTYDEMRPGCYEVKARVEDMLMNHTDVSLCFPTFPRFWPDKPSRRPRIESSAWRA